MMRITPMVKNILIINVGIAVFQWLLSSFLIKSFGISSLNDVLGLYVVFADEFAPYQFFTYMWLHAGMWHLLGNMFAVFIFGPLLEQVWGPKRFLTFYLICGIGAGVLFGVADFAEKWSLRQDTAAYLENPNPEDFRLFILDHKSYNYNLDELAAFSDQFYDDPNNQQMISETRQVVRVIYKSKTSIPMVGASGAVFGILMAFGMLFPNTQLFLLFPPIPIKAKYLVLFYGLYELYAEFTRMPGDNVAHLAHLGGMLIAFILLKVWQKKSGRFY